MTWAIRITAFMSWAGIGFLVFMMWRIARFYEHSSGKRAYAFLFLPPLVLLPGGAAYYIWLNPSFVGSVLADLMLVIGGVFLVLATSLLRQIMVGER